jgi:hypothetical protein
VGRVRDLNEGLLPFRWGLEGGIKLWRRSTT